MTVSFTHKICTGSKFATVILSYLNAIRFKNLYEVGDANGVLDSPERSPVEFSSNFQDLVLCRMSADNFQVWIQGLKAKGRSTYKELDV